ncbi:magnesium transporter [Bradyrhizobium sp. USDA 4503]|uniref:Magnesium transporter MgtE n=1 Tax=Bradyrhizobium brasilense TaxID=1419277 RepID=A0ABY8J6N4_9BRAD|nr:MULTISPECIES: magnesium transporter [Bradyrhizobium]KRQ09517.1 magnesium transporter [Bradyrhizobium pachyrhizi]MCC8948832.1 magnesium transporter [Bradyrhizobium brasilense]MCP1833059.1 magnesium transporter [Bradyrhizobium sp. USDA 4545]MCP1917804.1 magnesium transporter [Bradyrhizobium sp. USDA 4532]WFU60319.1 magnesium transporter [Bradyrhizobium brasilense]
MQDTSETITKETLAGQSGDLAQERAPEIVEALNAREPADAAKLLRSLPAEKAIEVLDLPGLDNTCEILAELPKDTAVSLLSGVSDDRAADIFKELVEPLRTTLLNGLNPETRNVISGLLAYPERSAGSIMTTEFVSVPSSWTIAEVLHHIRMVERTRETVYSIFVIDPVKKTLIQAVPLRRLISGDPHANVLTAAPARKPLMISPEADRMEAARLISRYDLLAVAVVDGPGHILGIVTVDDVIDAIVEESTEDAQKFGGMEAIDEPYLRIGFGEMIKKRAGWLCALFLSEMLTATAMQSYQSELEKAIVLTLFIPLIMSSGGNSGSQATSLLIRSLALHEVRLRDWWRVAVRELPTGIVLGAILGLIGVVRITLWQTLGLFDYGPHWVLVAATVGTALIGIVTFGSLCGSMLPFILKRIGFDPASASAPFVATLVDVTGLVIYFGVAAVILRGTLL